MCVTHRNSESVEEVMQLCVVCPEINQTRAFLLHQVGNGIIVVALILSSYDEYHFCIHAFQCIPACVYVCSLRVVYIVYSLYSGHLFQSMLHTGEVAQTFSYHLFFNSRDV